MLYMFSANTVYVCALSRVNTVHAYSSSPLSLSLSKSVILGGGLVAVI